MKGRAVGSHWLSQWHRAKTVAMRGGSPMPLRRYIDAAVSRGSFVTSSQFATPSEAVNGLYLGPYGNNASLVQPVTASGRSIVIEGGIKNGGIGVRQSLIIDRKAFQFGEGRGY